jgi:glycosyltransferase involved in cell wall biosynthesis
VIPMQSLCVVIPSRTHPLQVEFLTHAVESIRSQTLLKYPLVNVKIIVALDADAPVPAIPESPFHDVRYIHSTNQSQAAALNAGVAACTCDFIAFLEDDDTWHPQRLALTLEHFDLEDAGTQPPDFASSTQLEIDPAGNVLRINDFPTPSGWIMPRSTWEKVGPFDERFKFHLDNEWLGRLATNTNKKSLRRIHLVESTAPVDIEHALTVRPWLGSVIQNGGSQSKLVRHSLPVPLVSRRVHPNSGMSRIATDPACARQSNTELQLLQRRFHRIPW